jgi:Ran GTPase-activating protein (RanGAP) involved in mRNA processing and transport
MVNLETTCERLRSNASDLTILNLNYQGIGNRGAALLAQALRTNRTLVVLFLDGNDVSASGAKEIANALLHHPTLKQLYMSFNPIGDEGAQHISRSLSGTKLKLLKLSDCKIGTFGATALAEALRDDPSLVKLVLESNPLIGAEGSVTIANGLRHNETLRHLDLRDCVPNCFDASSTGRQVQQAFLDTLQVNKTMCELFLHDISMLEQAGKADALKRATQRERQLQHLLTLNRLGRRLFDVPILPRQLWPRILAAANAYHDAKSAPASSPALVYSILTMRPDLVPWMPPRTSEASK